MHLLTMQGSVLCVPNADGALTHGTLLPPGPHEPPMVFAASALIEGTLLRHPELGEAWLEKGGREATLRLQRNDRYLSVPHGSDILRFDQPEAGATEEFLPVPPAWLDDLRHILAHAWIERGTRTVLPRREVELRTFSLRIGPYSAPIAPGDAHPGAAEHMPAEAADTSHAPQGEAAGPEHDAAFLPSGAAGPMAADPIEEAARRNDGHGRGLDALILRRNGLGKPVALGFPRETGTVELVIAEPRSSALLRTEIWPVRARRTAEILALAAYRQIAGAEPDQEDFENTVAALAAQGGAPGLAGLLEDLVASHGYAASDRMSARAISVYGSGEPAEAYGGDRHARESLALDHAAWESLTAEFGVAQDGAEADDSAENAYPNRDAVPNGAGAHRSEAEPGLRAGHASATEDRDAVLAAWARREVAPWLMAPLSRVTAERTLLNLNETRRWAAVYQIAGGTATLLEKPDPSGIDDTMRYAAALYRDLLTEAAGLLPADFTATLGIGMYGQLHGQHGVPLFCGEKTPHSNFLLLPDVRILSGVSDEGGLRDDIPYDNKTIGAVFAGSTKGSTITRGVAQQFLTPRLRAARYFSQSASVDFRLPSIVQTDSQEARDFLAEQSFCQKPLLSWQEQFARRFLISMDGNGAACARVAIALRSQCALLKYESDRQLFYFGGLEPWRHYIPIAHDAEIERIIALEQASPGAFRGIAEDGARFARRFLTREALVRYTAFLLRAYADSFSDAAVTYGPNEGSTLIAHIASLGDVAGELGQWLGEKGTGRPIEGVLLSLRADLPREGFAIRPVIENGQRGAAVPSGMLAGSRGQCRPIYGLSIEPGADFEEGYDILLEASFTDGTTEGPHESWTPCQAASGAPLEAVRITILKK